MTAAREQDTQFAHWRRLLRRHPLSAAVALLVALLGIAEGLFGLLGKQTSARVVGAVAVLVLVGVLCAAALVRRFGGSTDEEPLATAAEPSLESDLPARREQMLGRDEKLRQVVSRLDTRRLVTLVGPGGTGKTLLALEAAREFDRPGEAPVRFVDLQSVREGGRVADTVGRALGLQEAPDVAALVKGVRSLRVLVVLDNCEHVLEECAAVVRALLNNCPQVRVLATSRSPLQLRDEEPVAVTPLPVPRSASSVSQALRSPAVRLFVEQAQRRRDDFSLSEHNLGSVLQICRRLDGLPLALIVAAAQVGHRGVSEISRALDDCLEWQGPYDSVHADDRRTLRSAIDCSVRLLSPRQAAVFRRLSVFAAPFSCEDAELVDLEGAGGVPDDVEALVEASLVVRTGDRGDKPVFRFLEVIRQYAEDALEDADETDRVRDAHLRYFVEVTERTAQSITGPSRLHCLALLEAHLADLRAALTWGGTGGRGRHQAQRLAGNLAWFWNFSGRLHEGRTWLEASVGWDGARSIGLARAAYGAGTMAFLQGDERSARRHLERSLRVLEELERLGDDEHLAAAAKGYVLCVLAINHTNGGRLEEALKAAESSVAAFEASGDSWGLALALNDLGVTLERRGDRGEAAVALARSEEAWRAIGDSWGLALVLTSRANAHLTVVDPEDPDTHTGRARQFVEEALALQSRTGDLWGAAVSHLVLGEIARLEGDYAESAARLVDSLQRNEQVDRPGVVGILLDRLAGVAACRGDGRRAAMLFGAADGFRQRHGLTLIPRERDRREPDLVLARGLLSEDDWQHAFDRGLRMTLEEATRIADPALDDGAAYRARTVSSQP